MLNCPDRRTSGTQNESIFVATGGRSDALFDHINAGQVEHLRHRRAEAEEMAEASEEVHSKMLCCFKTTTPLRSCHFS